jgi:hypothetical protein
MKRRPALAKIIAMPFEMFIAFLPSLIYFSSSLTGTVSTA